MAISRPRLLSSGEEEKKLLFFKNFTQSPRIESIFMTWVRQLFDWPLFWMGLIALIKVSCPSWNQQDNWVKVIQNQGLQIKMEFLLRGKVREYFQRKRDWTARTKHIHPSKAHHLYWVTSFHSIQDHSSLLILVTHGLEVSLDWSLTPTCTPPNGVVFLFSVKTLFQGEAACDFGLHS